MTVENPENLPAGRDPKTGKFLAGNKPVNHHAAVALSNHFRLLIKQCVSDEDMRAIVLAMATKAKRGDTEAASLVIRYCAGLPDSNVNLEQLSQGGAVTFNFNVLPPPDSSTHDSTDNGHPQP